ncbi:DUF2786 domain-containing protein [Pseudomonas fragi]|uniref:DUF2786 domain-containing protein n=1 Tax=Pseudomonas fragi TaxID=296 RepID=UPI001474D0B8|nr:DUF2786 domain-containing protein [Pseudomonas fragi]NNB15933.1 DUF2786 domain-containing protein [Pseudomonas fragi]NNB18443.1 DUF2786 domain-containing protein [Pseudomonas fragi]
MDHSKALEKIKKLLRLAASDNPHEAATAMRQARALMEKYRLEESDVQLAEVYECAARSGSKMTPPQWEANMVGAVSQAYACKVLFMTGIGEWRFIGEMAELASYTMTLLLRQVRQSRRDFISTQLKRCKTATKTKRADVFCSAWVSAVRKQVMAFAGNDEPSPATAAYMLKHHADTAKLDCRNRNANKGTGLRAMTDAMHGFIAAGDVRLNHGVNGQEQFALN